jgi:medium-chain acyl-[acyl-carrier-protein] hydrolase
MTKHPLIFTHSKKPNAKFRLICFPFAGGGISTYLPWARHLDSHIELSIVQLPGRGVRLFDEPYRTMGEMVQDLSDAIKNLDYKDTILFGHSMGAKVAYEVTLSLKDSVQYPIHLIASGSAAPNVERQKERIHHLANDLFVEKIGALNGTPQEVLGNPEIIELLLPSLKADFEIIENYINRNEAKQPIPVSVLAGDKDELDIGSIYAWFQMFTKNTGIHWVDGDHFFVDSNPSCTIAMVKDIIQQYI